MADNKKGTEAITDKGKGWFKGLKAEFAKINWATREDVTKQTIAVVVVSIILGIIIAVLDFILQSGINFLVSL